MSHIIKLKTIHVKRNSTWYRQHSNRMHTACLQLDVSIVCGGGCPQVNKFEQVTSDDPHVSVAGEGGVPRSDVWGGG